MNPSIRAVALYGAALVGALHLGGCAARSASEVEGETHWLSSCTHGESCGETLTCLCGVCTKACREGASACQSLGERARCAVARETPYQAQCSTLDVPLCVEASDVFPVENEAGFADSTVETPATSEPMQPVNGCADAGAAALDPMDLAATPRDNAYAEVLAVLAGSEIVAQEADYQRTLRDHDLLIATDVRLASFWSSGAQPSVGNGLTLELTEGADLAFEAAVRCLNESFEATLASDQTVGGRRFLFFTFDGVFNLDRLARVYAGLPGVLQAEPNVAVPPPVVLEDEAFVRSVSRDGDALTYAFDITKLDCTIQMSITIDGVGEVEITEWNSVPEAAACQRPDGGP